MKTAWRFLRAGEWYDSKIPMLLSVPLYLYLIKPCESSETNYFVLLLLAFFIFLFAHLSLGYVINDFSDIEVDKKAGKKKIITGISKPMIVLIIIILIVAGYLPLGMISKFDWKVIAVVLMNYSLGASYSLKPLRFKERGLAGNIISSSSQRCFPLLVLPFLFNVNIWLITGWFLLSFLNGLRYILIHQCIDYEADLKSGVNTFATKHNGISPKSVLACFITESLIILVLLAPLARSHYWLIAVPLIYTILAYSASYAVRKLMHQSFLLSYTYVPLEDFFNVALPLTFAVLWAVHTKSVWSFAVPFVLLGYLLYTISHKIPLIVLPIRVKFFGLQSN